MSGFGGLKKPEESENKDEEDDDEGTGQGGNSPPTYAQDDEATFTNITKTKQ